jgi:3-isopropylmalate dehydrogenase
MNKSFTVLVMPGEGVGPEVVREGVRVLRAVTESFAIPLALAEFEVGQATRERTGESLPSAARAACDALANSAHAAILFGSVADEPIGLLRKAYDLFANLRPLRIWPGLVRVSPLRPALLENVDLLIVRELVSDIYYGRATDGGGVGHRWAAQEMRYAEPEVRRIVCVALDQANRRRQSLTLVHKGNVIPGIHALWRDVLREERQRFPGVSVSDVLVDAAALHLVLHPARYDVLLCPNLFGDILSDLCGAIAGSLGLMPSASLNAAGFGLYECIGGTAPDIAGQQKANPIGTILSVAMMCRYTLRHEEAASAIEQAVAAVVATHRTSDIMEPGCQLVTTQELGRLIAARVGPAGGSDCAAAGCGRRDSLTPSSPCENMSHTSSGPCT